MLSWQEVVQNYLRHTDKVKRVTGLLSHYFNITHFQYRRIDCNGQFVVLGNRPDWFEHYVGEQFFTGDPFMKHPKSYRPGFCLTEGNNTEGYGKIWRANVEIFNIDMVAIYIVKCNGYVEMYGFSSNRQNSCLRDLYLNDHALLKRFASFFRKELDSSILKLVEAPVFLPYLKGNDFNSVLVNPGIKKDLRRAFLCDLGFNSAVSQFEQLSRRECQCLYRLKKGLTAKEIALELNLSHRTIEFYLENIKGKLACRDRREMISLAADYNDLGLFSQESL